MTEEEYVCFIQPYEDALKNIRVRVDVLNNDYRRKNQNYPIHHIQYRIKQKESIENKLDKNGYETSLDSARNYLTDVAGIRVICYFIRDIYAIVSLLKTQSDIVIIKESDYIANPKSNGYRSFHIVFGVPVYHTDGMEYYPVEIQLRTMSMDLWASMEHRICYKGEEKEQAVEEFKKYAIALRQMEDEMEEFL
ncbi:MULTISPECIES: GTP pyrophosphokinase [Clostridia]|uniref:(P)ppGpp synthetase n=1 Tax=Lacrimispora celerecrescens TaxID=29354 RepID=A0A084JLZ2_9FIRM|nr:MULTISPECIES: (p)ppGpp synthetase [Clostridia]KEZ89976.1 (p)ppGpp synthetase [Lacrimispora celerecrescens]MBW4845127.1 (p)ppGpp synthetase [Lachnospiraceae bacterium]MSS09995.1 (p)ppGpp synthetase [Clostridium sp. WB02_MRS01]